MLVLVLVLVLARCWCGGKGTRSGLKQAWSCCRADRGPHRGCCPRLQEGNTLPCTERLGGFQNGVKGLAGGLTGGTQSVNANDRRPSTERCNCSQKGPGSVSLRGGLVHKHQSLRGAQQCLQVTPHPGGSAFPRAPAEPGARYDLRSACSWGFGTHT